MRKLYNYCFYKVAHFYEKTEGDGLWTGTLVTVGTASWLVLAVINVLFAALHYEPKDAFYYCYAIVSLIIILFIAHNYDTDEKYRSLCKQYENERFATLKGWIILFCILLSVVLLVLSVFIRF